MQSRPFSGVLRTIDVFDNLENYERSQKTVGAVNRLHALHPPMFAFRNDSIDSIQSSSFHRAYQKEATPYTDTNMIIKPVMDRHDSLNEIQLKTCMRASRNIKLSEAKTQPSSRNQQRGTKSSLHHGIYDNIKSTNCSFQSHSSAHKVMKRTTLLQTA